MFQAIQSAILLQPLHVSKLKKKLFSVRMCTQNGFVVTFKEDRVDIMHNNTIICPNKKLLLTVIN